MPTTFEIFPPIGIARVGTSQEFFIGPEPDTPLDLVRRDPSGNLRRQAARFRVYECDRDATGMLIGAREITADAAHIRWSVHLVNRKAAAREFGGGSTAARRRNGASGNDTTDRNLIIDAGNQPIDTPGTRVVLDAGKFKNLSVPLGRLEMQSDARLCVVGGAGTSRSPSQARIRNFADNDDWHDDVADGPVTAQITVGANAPVTAKPAWVVVAPPDFAPQITNIITMFDVLQDLAVQRGLRMAPETIFFDRHIRLILERAMSTQWVNRQARLGYDDNPTGAHSSGGPGDFSDMFAMLGDPTQSNEPRQAIFRLLRNPETLTVPAPVPSSHMPRLNDDKNSGAVLPFTRLQHRAFRRWAEGNFQRSDPAGALPELLPDAITRMALEACAGGAFFPGIEAGRIMTEASRFIADDAFRLSPQAVRPGEITAQNAVPWQADFHQCRWEESDNGRPKRLGWWPAQRPDDVLKAADENPVPWARGLKDTGEAMVQHWHRLGFVKRVSQNPDVFLEDERDRTLAENGAV